jgi:hypothetical protein
VALAKVHQLREPLAKVHQVFTSCQGTKVFGNMLANKEKHMALTRKTHYFLQTTPLAFAQADNVTKLEHFWIL